jgi:hypothetical protein
LTSVWWHVIGIPSGIKTCKVRSLRTLKCGTPAADVFINYIYLLTKFQWPYFITNLSDKIIRTNNKGFKTNIIKVTDGNGIELK